MRLTHLSIASSTVLAVLAYLFAFGLSVYVSVDMLFTDVSSNAGSSAENTLISQGLLVCIGLLCGYGATLIPGREWLTEWIRGRRPTVPGAGLVSAGAALGGSLLGYAVIAPFTSNTYTRVAEADGNLAIAAAHAFVVAGIGEELIVLALPVVLLRAMAPRALHGRWLALVLVVLVCLRMAYHLYYGWSALTLLPWALITGVVYLRWGRVWPLVIEHTVYNTSLAAVRAELLSLEATLTLLAVGAGACLVTGTLLIWRHRRTNHSTIATATPWRSLRKHAPRGGRRHLGRHTQEHQTEPERAQDQLH